MNLFDEKYIDKLKLQRKYDNSFGERFVEDNRFSSLKIQIEGWFSQVNKKRKKEIRGNFFSPYYNQHWSAFWEMSIADYFVKSGFEIKWGKDAEPDLWVEKESVTIAVEIRGLYPSDDQNEANQRMEKLVEMIDNVGSPVALSICTVLYPIPENADLEDITSKFAVWLNNEANLTIKDSWYYNRDSCRIRIDLLPDINIGNGKSVHLYSQAIIFNRERYLNESIFDDKQKYADELEKQGIPYIIALGNSSDFSISEQTLERSLFGKQTITFDLIDPSKTESGRDGKGYIVPKQEIGGPENTWLGGIIYFKNEFTLDQIIINCSYFDNHWASNPISKGLLEMKTFRSTTENDQVVTYSWINGDDK